MALRRCFRQTLQVSLFRAPKACPSLLSTNFRRSLTSSSTIDSADEQQISISPPSAPSPTGPKDDLRAEIAEFDEYYKQVMSDPQHTDHIQVKSVREALRAGLLKGQIRQHVNPFTWFYQQPLILPSNWLHENFEDITKPLHLDIGCARGSWTIKYGAAYPERNVLGLEIRRPMVDYLLLKKKLKKLTNVHFMFANVSIHLKTILSSINANGAQVLSVTTNFPDPQFKRSHRKRRIVDHKFVNTLAEFLPPGAVVFMQSDVEELMQDMASYYFQSPYFSPAENQDTQNLTNNQSPYSFQTEREIATLAKNLPVYRLKMLRNGTVYQKV